MVRRQARTAGTVATARGLAIVLALALGGCTPTTPPTSTPSVASSPSPSQIDTSTWTVYESSQYGFTVKHPPGWAAKPATHPWTLTGDATNWMSTGQDRFSSAAGDVWVTVWSTPAKGMPETPEGVAAWIEKYCQHIDEPCPGVQDRAAPLCHTKDLCHPGLLVETPNREFRAFFTGGEHAGQIVGVAIWRPEWDQPVAKYGGARRLLEGFLSGMDVCVKKASQVPSGCG